MIKAMTEEDFLKKIHNAKDHIERAEQIDMYKDHCKYNHDCKMRVLKLQKGIFE